MKSENILVILDWKPKHQVTVTASELAVDSRDTKSVPGTIHHGQCQPAVYIVHICGLHSLNNKSCHSGGILEVTASFTFDSN